MNDPFERLPGATGPDAVPRMALYLGWGGTLPVVAIAGLALLLPSDGIMPFLSRAALVYGAVILSFIGGAHWGFASRGGYDDDGTGEQAKIMLTRSVIPSLLAWFLALYGGPLRFVLMAALFLGLLPLDRWAIKNGFAPSWWMALRIPLTLILAGGFVVLSFAA